MAFEYVSKALSLCNATVLKDGAITASAWAQGHPVQAGMTTLSLGLAPFFGVGWMPALLLKGVGFEKVGVGAGKFCHVKLEVNHMAYLVPW